VAGSVSGCAVLTLGAEHGCSAIEAGTTSGAKHALHLSGNTVQSQWATDGGEIGVGAHVARRAELAEARTRQAVGTCLADAERHIVGIGV